MKRQSVYERARDQRVADSAGLTDEERALRCSAMGCPRPWAVQGDRGKACSAHYWADPADWPRITENLQRDEVERAMRFDSPAPPMTREQRHAVLARLASLGRASAQQASTRAWAQALHERHQRGERLTDAQVAACRAVLPHAFAHPDDDFGEGQP